ncbi:hypothetical protein D3C80_1822960 [compost metagenome]
MLWVFAGQESGKGVDSSQPRIARCYTIVTLLFQMRQELADLLCRKIVKFQILDAPFAASRGKSQEQHDGIPIAANRVQAHATELGQILPEEVRDAIAKRVGPSGFHGAPPAIKWPKWAWKRSLAAAAISGIQRR